MLPIPTLAVRAGLVLVLTTLPAAAHGGVYRGPGATVPPGGPPVVATGGSPTAGSTSTGDISSWESWWGFNRDPYLQLRRAIHAAEPLTGQTDFFLGAGQRDGVAPTLAPTPAVLHGKVVPALLTLLEGEHGNDLTTAALIALAKIGPAPPGHGGPDLEQAVLPHLKSSSQEIAETAALALGILGADARVFALADLLDGEARGQARIGARSIPLRTRAFAAYGLGLVAGSSTREDVRRFAVHKLARALRDDEARSRDLRVACLLSIGQIPLEAGGDWSEEQGEAPPLPSSSREAQLRFVLDVLRDPEADRVLRGHAPRVLARLLEGASPAVRGQITAHILAPLADHARSPIEVRQGCVTALGAIGDADSDPLDAAIRERLRAASQELQQEARWLALISLARVSARPGSGAGAPETLSATRSFLLSRLARSTANGRPWAAIALGLLEHHVTRAGIETSSDVTAALRARLADASSPQEIGACCIALGLAGDVAATPLVRSAISASSNDAARSHAALALGLLRADVARDELREIVRASTYRPGLLVSASVGLGLMGDKGLVPELIGMLRTSSSLSSQAAIASALGAIGDARAVDSLLELLADETLTTGARAFAAAALGLVGDRRTLPWNTPFAVDVNYRETPATLYDPGTGRGLLDIL